MTDELVRCARALVSGETREDYAFVVRDGRIVASGDFLEVRDIARELETRSFPADRLVVPGFINGHSHAYQILLRGWADDWPFAKWRSEALYRVVPRLTPDDVYWTFVAAFSEMLAAGITTVAEFFYLNGAGNEHAEAAIRAARDAGIRLILARTWMDASYAPPEFCETADVAAQRTLELMQRCPDANVCVAPHSLHAASPEMIRDAAAFSQRFDCMLHIHIAEAPYEGQETLARFGATPIALLEELGALNGRTVAVHAIHLSEPEKKMLARAGARVVHNPMTNQYLGDGICDVVGLRSLGVPIGLGTDADIRPSLIDEMRSAALLAKLRSLDGSALGAREAFAMGTSEGVRALALDAGDLLEGGPADYVVLDASEIDPWSPERNALVYRGQDAWVQATFVNGRRVYVGEASPLARRARSETALIAERLCV
ncbi:MAG: amidohydrolase family protein [Candidatus Cybelea sp.]|jgi:5-methylthioadenosine/S-adenosylhomocysteine deaminase